MANSTISGLTAKTTPVSADLFVIVDSDASDNKKLTYGNLKTALHNSPTLVTPALGTPASGNLSNCNGSPTFASVTTTNLFVGPIIGTIQEDVGDDPKGTLTLLANSIGVCVDDSYTTKYAPLLTSNNPTGTGEMVLASHPTIEHPTLTTPVLGTPASGDLTNCTIWAMTQEAEDSGTAGQICFDSSYLYICTATDTWKRVALEAVPA